MKFFSGAINSFKAMPTWQKGLTIVGVLTVGATITYASTKGVEAIVAKIKSKRSADEIKKDLKEAVTELKDTVKKEAAENTDIAKTAAADTARKIMGAAAAEIQTV